MEAGEPEERAAEEKEVEEKFGERKAENIGSEAKESRGDWAVELVDVDVVVVVVEGEPPAVGDLKVERRCRGEEEDGGEDDESGDLWSVNGCDAIFAYSSSKGIFWFRFSHIH